MPRNAAKKTNKNAKRLPVLNKLTNTNLNRKKKKLHTNRKNNNNIKTSKNKTKINCCTPIKDITQKQKHYKNTKKVIDSETFPSFNRIQENNTTFTTLSSIPDEQTINLTTANKTHKKTTFQQPKIDCVQQESVESILLTNQQCRKIYNLEQFHKIELKEQEYLNFGNHFKDIVNNVAAACKTEQETNSILSLTTTTSLSEISSKLFEPDSLSPEPSSSSLRCFSPNTSVSSLYPIVIESFQQDNNNNNKDKEQRQGNNNKKKKKKTHSIKNCNGKNRNRNNSNSNNTNNNCTCCHTAVDTLEQHKSQNNNNKNKNKAGNNCLTTSIIQCNNCNKQKQSTQSSRKVLTLYKPPPQSSTNQSQEVKARLATLRIRKNVSQQQQQQQQQQLQLQLQEQYVHKTAAQRTQKTSCSVAATVESTTNVKDIPQKSETEESSKTTAAEAGKQFTHKKAPAILDQASLNLIETLNDDVKKPNNKRKRNNSTTLLLGLATLLPARPKRVANNNLSQIDKPLSGCVTAAQDKNEKQQIPGHFIKPASVEATNTNSKKRARIMSLYERPFQTANDGRGSVVGNGYMTSSRTSSSSGGASGAIVMTDNCDTQEMSSQYYLAGSSGAGLSGNTNSSLLANGSAINHAPTMGTLCNIGNTCYLNSVVYTLRFAPQFLHNLHHLLADLNALQQNIAKARAKSSSLGRGISAVHLENARSWSSKDLASMEQYNSGSATNSITLGANATTLKQVTQKSSHQLLTEKLHDLYQSLHRNEINETLEPHHADTLLHAIQDVSSIFEGNQQQDAHEFLMCLLNSIRETSQTLIKAIAECPDVILNGYISNSDDIERELIKSHASGSSGIGSGGVSNSNNSNSLASTSSKTSFFSRKSKRKDESKNSKNSRLQSPLKDALLSGNNPQHTTTTANSLFYLNTNDLNSTVAASSPTPATATIVIGGVVAANSSSLTSPSNVSSSSSSQQVVATAVDETDNAPTSSVALILKDKQRLEGKIKELGLDFFNEDFEGITVSTTKCLSCETITEQKETMIDIAVPVPQAGYESNDSMNRPSSFIQNSCITREYFRNENKYRCEQCCGYTEAIRSISYEVLPRLLIIQLSRFSGGMEKINSYIPTSFTLQCFCSKCCELSDANKLHIYKLYSVITHVGATMSVGHYIAYTCSLEWANEYINCPKEQKRRASQERNLATTASNGSSSAGNNSSSATAGASSQLSSSAGMSTSSTGFMKMKMKFGRSKASSSGDMSKNVKQLNGLNASSSSKAITNGIGKLTMNNSGSSGLAAPTAMPQCPIACQSVNCCAMRLNVQQQLQYQSANNITSDLNEEFSQYFNGTSFTNQANYNNNIHNNFANAANSSGYGSTGRGATKASYGTIQNNCSEPIWYMCDDDKIKAMTQKEFEELLSPARKITITPYLLFYARYNLQSTPPKTGTVTTSSPGPVTSSPQTSWSNESLQSSGHSAHSSGMRM